MRSVSFREQKFLWRRVGTRCRRNLGGGNFSISTGPLEQQQEDIFVRACLLIVLDDGCATATAAAAGLQLGRDQEFIHL